VNTEVKTVVTGIKILVKIIKVLIVVFKHNDHLQKLLEELESKANEE